MVKKTTRQAVKPEEVQCQDKAALDIEEFLAHLAEATNLAFTQITRKHSQISVLLMQLQDCDLEPEGEIAELESIFRENYKFDTQRFKIPSENAQREAEDAVTRFRDQGRNHKSSLLILYYNGHASGPEPFKWCGEGSRLTFCTYWIAAMLQAE